MKGTCKNLALTIFGALHIENYGKIRLLCKFPTTCVVSNISSLCQIFVDRKMGRFCLEALKMNMMA
mgnify:CR=1 FL=1